MIKLVQHHKTWVSFTETDCSVQKIISVN